MTLSCKFKDQISNILSLGPRWHNPPNWGTQISKILSLGPRWHNRTSLGTATEFYSFWNPGVGWGHSFFLWCICCKSSIRAHVANLRYWWKLMGAHRVRLVRVSGPTRLTGCRRAAFGCLHHPQSQALLMQFHSSCLHPQKHAISLLLPASPETS
jgi:hypothetical protein